MPSLTDLTSRLRTILLFTEEFDPDQPRDSDGRFAKVGSRNRTVGQVGQYKGLHPDHMERLVTARESAVNAAAIKAKHEVIRSHGFEPWDSSIPQEVQDAAMDADIRVRGADLTDEKNAAEQAERDEIDREFEEDRAVESATKAGHVKPIPADKFEKARAHAKAAAAELDKLGTDLHKAQLDAADAVHKLDALNIGDEYVDDDGDPYISNPISSEEVLSPFSQIRNGVLSTAESLRTAAGEASTGKNTDSDHDYTETSGDEIEDDAPEYIDPSEALKDPTEDADDEVVKGPGSFEDFVKTRDLDFEGEDDPEGAKEEAENEYESLLDDHNNYLKDKEAYDDQQSKIKKFAAYIEQKQATQKAQAGVAQAALEKVYALQSTIADRLKTIESEHSKKVKDSVDEAAVDPSDLINDGAFSNKPRKAGNEEEFQDPENQQDYDDARLAAEAIVGRESDRRESMEAKFEDPDTLRDGKKEILKAIKTLSKLTKIPPSAGTRTKAKPKTKTKAKAVGDDGDEDQDDDAE